MGKIIEGHTLAEYLERYGEKFNNGKLQFFKLADEKKLDYKKNYWLIKDKKPGYYQVNSNILFIPFVILGVAAVTTAIVVPCTLLSKCSGIQEVNVSVPPIPEVTYSNLKAYIGKDFDTNISVDTTQQTKKPVLPDTLTRVTSGTREILSTEYTYTPDSIHENASLHIPGKFIEGDVIIEFKLINPPAVSPLESPIVSAFNCL